MPEKIFFFMYVKVGILDNKAEVPADASEGIKIALAFYLIFKGFKIFRHFQYLNLATVDV